ncbi:uncharacterized protein PODANS_1_20010 [Podospora anserina S mat+]|uniref:Podospora anserina S mat+ genomic DNA chromosome 1, supercontig 4 n=2 Tax=Podospora anserina TaxID=2587412 RepID=B2AUR3_PODAN|nr:uncharacterized protein PODANS_1_20010 [Podospora anserina S mat+]CAP68136.1 unnamed protein product [Podospora anserina S mat+]CDN29918.1 Putative protein of unknown function [Podospora anserina]CDP24390.1 Putative protein of unknown function [Podospora anserina S mat+]
MSGDHHDSQALEARASPEMGTMSTPPRRPARPRRPNARESESIYKIRYSYDPWNLSSWSKAGESRLSELLATATDPPIEGFWKSIKASKVVGKWFDYNDNEPIVTCFRFLELDYDRAMKGWMNTLRSGSVMCKKLTDMRVERDVLREQNSVLTNENYHLKDQNKEAEDLIGNLEDMNHDLEDQVKDLTQQLRVKQVENRRLNQTLSSRKSLQTTPGGTVIEDGRVVHTMSDDIARKERDDYLANITRAEDKAEAAQARVGKLEDKVARLRAALEAINPAAELTSTGAIESVTVTAAGLQAQKAQYEEWMKELKDENAVLKAENEDIKAASNHLETAMQVLREGNEETLKKEKEKVQAEIRHLRDMLSEQRSEMSGKLQKKEQELKDLWEQYDRVKRRAEELEKKVRRLEVDSDNQINQIRQQVENFGRASRAYIPQLNRLDQLINQTEANVDQHRESAEKAKPILEQAGKLKKNQNPSPETVSGLADLVNSMYDVFNSPAKDKEEQEPGLKEAKETRDAARNMIKELEGLNEMLLGWRSRVRSGLGSPTALRHEGDMIASSIERLQHQYRRKDTAEKASRRKPEPVTPSKKPREERSPLITGRRVTQRKAPPNLVFVDEPEKNAPETSPNTYPFEHEISSVHSANLAKLEAVIRASEEGNSPSPKGALSSPPREPQSPGDAKKSPEAPKPSVPKESHAKSPSIASGGSSPSTPRGPEEDFPFDDRFNPDLYKVLEGFITILGHVTMVTDEDNRKLDNSFLKPLLQRYEPEMKTALKKVFEVTGQPPYTLLAPTSRKEHELFYVCRAYKEFQLCVNPGWDAVLCLNWLQECKQGIASQIEARKGTIEYERYLTSKFADALEVVIKRHEEGDELRTRYNELETELLGTKLSTEEEFYVDGCVKRHLDSGRSADYFEDLVWEVAPVIKREVKLSGITNELEKWVNDYSEWVDGVFKPDYIEPLKQLIKTLKKKIADRNDMDDKILLEARVRRLKKILRHDPVEDLSLKDTLKSPLEVVTTNILVNQDAVEDQYATRRRRIESLIREKVMHLYSTKTHSKHAEAACFCSLLKYFAPKLYYNALSDGCCGHGQMVTVIEEGTNAETQPVKPDDPSLASNRTSTRRSRRTCQGHHGHGVFSASTTVPTVICHILTSFLWVILFALSAPAEFYSTILLILTTPFDMVGYAFAWVKYLFRYIHWRFFPKNYAENYHPPTFTPPTFNIPSPPTSSTRVPPSRPRTPTSVPSPRSERSSPPRRLSTASYIPSLDSFSNPFRRASASDVDERSESTEFPMRRDGGPPPKPEPQAKTEETPPVDPFAFRKTPTPAPSVADDASFPPPPPRPAPFKLSTHTASPASLIICLSILTTVFSSVLYLALDQERRIWLSNNNWRRAFVNDMLEPFASKNTRAAAWANWGVLAFPASALARAVNRVFVRRWPRWASVVPWDTERAVVDITWADRTGVSGASEQSPGFLRA